ncbi:MAG: hypothetical protein KJ647_00100 [Candidatus Omnitrophica bacterium]|nr:hypothetical protein [Candidatus Omnitrophota bacterium]MBU4418665.1 hypothetical protein [Candidatus Omnitrophota bacterium]MCG2707274.1 hypothetical protein [Candidatus Omnitrophota bacterium]
MRKEILCLAIVALMVLGLSSQGFCMANRPPASKKPTPKQAESIQKVSGMVSGYDRAKSTISIAPTNGSLITVEIDKASKISKAGKWIKMTDIKTGDVVSVAYETKGWKKIARTLIVQEKAATKAAIPEKKKK